MSATFFTVSNSRYFVGTVCLVNSLRLVGHREEIVILDQGLEPGQRDLLSSEATILSSERVFGEDDGSKDRVFLAKPYPSFLNPEGVVVIIDGDMMVTRPLHGPIAHAMNGSVFAYSDPEDHRWFAEWDEIFGLTSPLRRQSYVNAGFAAFSPSAFPELLPRWWELCQRLEAGVGAERKHMVLHLDQDALNALLMSEVLAGTTVVGDVDEEPAFDELARARLHDARTLDCSLHGKRSVILHNAGAGKPWEAYAWIHLRRNPYVDLIPRLLFEPDVAIRLQPDSVPIWLRPSARGRAARAALSAANNVKVRALLPLWRRVPAGRRRSFSKTVLALVPRSSRPPARNPG